MPAHHASELKDEYKRIAGGYAKRNAKIENFPTTLAAAEKFALLLPSRANILDLGCGNGRDAEWFEGQGFQMTLFDLSDEMLAEARKRVHMAKLIQGDMMDLPFTDVAFDGIWANTSLLHLTKSECLSVVKKLKALVTRDGKLFISVKQGEGEKYLEHEKYGEKSIRFFSLYTPHELQSLVQEAGWEILSIEEQAGSTEKYVYVFATNK